jgi:membrane-associated phospholipid phosphatase
MIVATAPDQRARRFFFKEVVVLAMVSAEAFAQTDSLKSSTRTSSREWEPSHERLLMEWEYGKDVRPSDPPAVLSTLEFGPSDSGGAAAKEEFVPAWYDMITNIPGDWGRSFRMTFSTSSIPTILGLSAVTLGFVAIDQHLYHASKVFYKSSTDAKSASDFFVSLGDGKSQFLMAGAFAAYGVFASDQRALRTASQTVEAVVATGVVIQVLKHISGRESPAAAGDMHRGTWRPFPNLKEYHSNQTKYYAFPSGHIATAMAALTVVAENYHEAGWIRPVGYPVVGLIGISLVNKGFHWYSDLPLGVAIGYVMGKVASHPEAAMEETISEEKALTMSITPAVSVDGGGVQFSVFF